MYEVYTKYRTFVELFLTISIFCYLIYSGEMLGTIQFNDIVYAILSFIVILELVKMLGQYIFDRRFRVTLVLDTFFVFTLRETILVYTDKNMDEIIDVLELDAFIFSVNEKIFYIIMGIGIMMVILYFRPKCKRIEKISEEKRGRKCRIKRNK